MNTALVLTLIGPNTTGIVYRLAHTAALHDANWLGARMANLAGQFAGIVHLDVPDEKAEALSAALHELEGCGMRLLITRGSAGTKQSANDLLRLDLIGQDHPGIVRDISGVLAQHEASIENLVTERVSSAFAGNELFRATAQLRVPGNVVVPELRASLESLAHELMVDLTLDSGLAAR